MNWDAMLVGLVVGMLWGWMIGYVVARRRDGE